MARSLTRAIGCGLSACILGLALAACVTTLVPTAPDRDATITVEDFDDWLGRYDLETLDEKLTKQSVLGMYELIYQYRGESHELSVYVGSSVYLTRSPGDGKRAYNALGFGAKRGTRELSWERAHIEIGWPEEAENYLLKRSDGQTVGNVFLGRRGRVAVLVVMTGVYAGDAGLFAQHLEPHLWKLSAYDPAEETVAER